MPTIIPVVGDLHVNSTVGLMPPVVTLDDGQTVEPSATQEWIWSKWLDYWARIDGAKRAAAGATVVGIINGDWGDMNRHSGFQLVEPENPDTVITMMTDAVRPMRRVCDHIIVVRGTEAHTGGVGWLENRAAHEIGAERNTEAGTRSWYYFEGGFDGVRIVAAHHPGTNATRSWTAGNEANRRAAMDTYNYFGRSWVPHLSLWGHYHHYADSHDTHPVRAFYNGCWQIKTAFTHRLGLGGNDENIGGAVVFCNAGRYELRRIPYTKPRPKPWTMS